MANVSPLLPQLVGNLAPGDRRLVSFKARFCAFVNGKIRHEHYAQKKRQEDGRRRDLHGSRVSCAPRDVLFSALQRSIDDGGGR
jgi:hypothetical protein